MRDDTRKFMGIGIGASTVKVAVLSKSGKELEVVIEDHHGSPREHLMKILRRYNPADIAGVIATGRETASQLQIPVVFEAEAVESGLRLLNVQADAIASLGGESFVIYPLDEDGKILDYVSGNKCAAGTVEFFKQQLMRMNLNIEEATRIAHRGSVVPLAKRCSVHCKSDCTHALNKRKCNVEDIVMTLCHNMAEKVYGLLNKSRITDGRIVLIGGASQNKFITDHLREFFKEGSIIVPRQGPYFEALGAAVLAMERQYTVENWDQIFAPRQFSFATLDSLIKYEDRVTYLPSRHAPLREDRTYLLGVDGGSTTTKVALVDTESLEICASHYGRTNGNPEAALKECLEKVSAQVIECLGSLDAITIEGVATTGSSGEILSVIADTPAYHNEIVAHACGASYFCPDVDTIFEIGGQDSKFTRLRQGVAVDFNMNESCSAGTGSFIEESAKEDLGVPMEAIADLAVKSENPPRFSDQCAAFANTDTRKAAQEGATREDNLAGLIYSIVENYLKKIVGERQTGNNILFQGGTSKNRAIALAFAAKTGKHITVPPDSELMGAFGISLWLREKIRSGEMEKKNVDIQAIIDCDVKQLGEFTCKSCENFCSISRIEVNGRKFPFGGQCSKWENARNKKDIEPEKYDYVKLRNDMLFRRFAPQEELPEDAPTVGMQGVFSVYTLYPLYAWFFHQLGFKTVLSETVDPEGIQKCQSARCYPYEIAHGTFQDLLKKETDYCFVPHLVGLPADKGLNVSVTCPIAQAVPHYLKAAFDFDQSRFLDPVFDLTHGLDHARGPLVQMAAKMGIQSTVAEKAFEKAMRMQQDFWDAGKEKGREILADLEKTGQTGIVLLGRPYNAYSRVANMGVPRKFSSQGYPIIPHEFIPCDEEPGDETMYWKYGQSILKAVKFIVRSPNLFPVYISNFGCGPDSFIQHFVNFIMGRKPYLYLELDSHTADAGIGTRVSAFLDIIEGFKSVSETEEKNNGPEPAQCVPYKSRTGVRTSSGEVIPLNDPRVTLAFPSMGEYGTAAISAAFRRLGIRAIPLPPVDDRVLQIGRDFTSGKECLPAIFTIGSMIDYCRNTFKKERKDEVLVFFMPTAGGPCRFGQYNVYMKILIKTLGLKDVAVFSPTAENGYGGLGLNLTIGAWSGVILSDLMMEIRSALMVCAQDTDQALDIFQRQWNRIISAMEKGEITVYKTIKRVANELKNIPLKQSPSQALRVLLAGEIFVRCDRLARRSIEDMYAEHGIIIKRADIMEWVYYTDWEHTQRLKKSLRIDDTPRSLLTLLKPANLKKSLAYIQARTKFKIETFMERLYRSILARSGLLFTHKHDIDEVVKAGSKFINPALCGEAILSAGVADEAIHSSHNKYDGIIFIGPFNCMPTGVAESVIKPHARNSKMPYITFDTDGGPLSPNFVNQLEVNIMRVKRHRNPVTRKSVRKEQTWQRTTGNRPASSQKQA